MAIPARRLLALDEAAGGSSASDLGRSKKLAHDGHMPYVKLGRATRYDLADLDAYVDRNRRRNRRSVLTARLDSDRVYRSEGIISWYTAIVYIGWCD